MKPYRKNVGIVVFNARGQVLAGERSGAPGAFQFPQGGIDPGEEPLAAARRELFEEIGLKIEDPPVRETEDWLRYDFPDSVAEHLKPYQGQEQKWFFFFWDGNVAELSLDHHDREFERLAWLRPEEVLASIVYFKRDVYATVVELAKQVMAQYSGPCLCFELSAIETPAKNSGGRGICPRCQQRYLLASFELDHGCADGSWIFVKKVDEWPDPLPVELDAAIQKERPYFAFRKGDKRVHFFP
ncbi:MAG: RNA pyrophosphohydrolase [Spirochaetales bacterium]|nr:RNA pyrophosphohydrolase [Spirochaetales bacterium]